MPGQLRQEARVLYDTDIAASSLVLTIIADGVGRRRMLGLGVLPVIASGIVYARCSNYWVLVAASALGVVSLR
jgi:predicted MFS family arabinose efflux permease